MKSENSREGEVKNKLAKNYFASYDCTKEIGNIDFCVTLENKDKSKPDTESLLWAEAKRGKSDILNSIVQLILTIGKAKTYEKYLPPAFLGAFDAEQIAFIPYNEIHHIFYIHDFDWKVTPSDYQTKQFKLVKEKVQSVFNKESLVFNITSDNKEIKEFIKTNFIIGKSSASKVRIDKNNFKVIFDKWLSAVQPTISIDWESAKTFEIFSCDFYLADLLSKNNHSLKESLFVVLKATTYKMNKGKNIFGAFDSTEVEFKDNQKAHTEFWNRYERPPKEEYWEYILDRRDLLVPQDIRSISGSYFTPQIWVEKSQNYIADTLGEDWQKNYYIWDCAAGTGNLLANLTNKYNIYASTLYKQDVDVIHDRINVMNSNSPSGNGANLLHDNVFKFDFLNDDFSKLPTSLQSIINDTNERKKLIIYINPPYKEAGEVRQRTKTGKNKTDVAKNKVHDKYHTQLGGANRQLYAQFLIRIYNEIPDCLIAEFSTLKTLSSAHFDKFRDSFRAKLLTAFVVPADSFDNVDGQFPIGFKIWNTEIKEKFNETGLDVFDKDGDYLGTKNFYSFEGLKYFSEWVGSFKLKSGINIGWLQGVTRNDFQNQNGIIIKNNKNQIAVPRGIDIYPDNLIKCCVCYAVRMSIPADWLNDCDQFLEPNDGYKSDIEFQNDCLIYTNFSEKNTIQANKGTNHWIPFTEEEVNAKTKFASRFMSEFISGKKTNDLFNIETEERKTALVFSEQAKAVLDAGLKLWQYYHKQNNPKYNVNASLYDIREYFQGRNNAGKMNNKSEDETYNELIGNLRDNLKILAKKIEPKIYEYGFLKA